MKALVSKITGVDDSGRVHIYHDPALNKFERCPYEDNTCFRDIVAMLYPWTCRLVLVCRKALLSRDLHSGQPISFCITVCDLKKVSSGDINIRFDVHDSSLS